MSIFRILAAIIFISLLGACTATSTKDFFGPDENYKDTSTSLNNISVKSSVDFEKFLYAKGLYQQGKLDQALPVLKALSDQKTNSPEVYLYLANINFKKNDYVEAAKHYRTCLAIDPNNAFALFNLSLVDILQSEQRLALLQKIIPSSHINFSKTTQLRQDLRLLIGREPGTKKALDFEPASNVSTTPLSTGPLVESPIFNETGTQQLARAAVTRNAD